MAALEDFSKFYFLFATKNDIENNVRAWNNESERYDFYRSHVLNMGNALSVHSACRISNFVMHVCLRLAGIPVLVYIDDGIIVTSPELLELAVQFYRELADLMKLLRKG